LAKTESAGIGTVISKLSLAEPGARAAIRSGVLA